MAASEVGTWDQRMRVARVRGRRQSAGRHGAEGTVGGPGAGVRPRDSQRGQGLSQAALGGAQVSATARCPELGCCLGTPPPPPWPIGPCVGVGTPFVSLQPSRRQRGTGEPWRQVFKGVGWSGRLLRRAAEAMTGEGGRRGRGAPSMVLPRGGDAAVQPGCPWLQGRELHPPPWHRLAAWVALPGLGRCTSPSSCTLGQAASQSTPQGTSVGPPSTPEPSRRGLGISGQRPAGPWGPYWPSRQAKGSLRKP